MYVTLRTYRCGADAVSPQIFRKSSILLLRIVGNYNYDTGMTSSGLTTLLSFVKKNQSYGSDVMMSHVHTRYGGVINQFLSFCVRTLIATVEREDE